MLSNYADPSEVQRRRCACCSSPAEPDSDLCSACFAELNASPSVALPPTEVEPAQELHIPELVNLEEIPAALVEAHGLTRVNWPAVHGDLTKRLHPTDYNAGWAEAECQWLHILRDELGGAYRIQASRNFILLADLPLSRRRSVLQFCERAWDFINHRLPGVVKLPPGARTPVIVLSDHDDYLAYTAYFEPDGITAFTSGMCIYSGSIHVVTTAPESHWLQHILAHELAHAAVPHLTLPVWLNEGLAMTSEREAVGFNEPLVDAEKSLRHRNFWNGENIQFFWSGSSFHTPGDSQELSYNLAEVMVQLAGVNHPGFASFVTNAKLEDAGQTAAHDYLGVCLADLLTQFLGPGDWRPDRRLLARRFQKPIQPSARCSSFGNG